MADTVTGPTILEENDNRVTIKVVVQSDGSGGTTVMGDVSALAANILGQAVKYLSVQQLWFSCSAGDGGDAFARLDAEDSDGDIPIITLVGKIPANKSNNSNEYDINLVIPSTADSGNTFSVIAEFQKLY
jgi:hypothetical protein